MLATLTNSGRAAIVLAISSQPLHFAWGVGNPQWDDDSTGAHLGEILIDKISLESEIGRRSMNTVGFVVPDEQGDITIPVGRQPDGTVAISRYRQVTDPSPYLYLKAIFDFADAHGAIIREVAVFMGTEIKEEILLEKPGQRYFTLDELASPGQMLAIQRLDPVIERSPAVRPTFEFVLPI